MKQNNRSFSIKKRFLILFVLLGMGIILLFSFSLWSYYSIQKKMYSQTQTELSNQVRRQVEEKYQETEKILKSIAYNKTTQLFLASHQPEYAYETYQQVYSLMNNSKNINTAIVDIALANTEGNFINVFGDATLYQSIQHPKGETNAFFHGQYDFNTGRKIVTCQVVSLPVYQLSAIRGNPLGMLYLSLDAELLTQISSAEQTESEFLIINAEDKLVAGNQELYFSMKDELGSSTVPDSFIFDQQDYQVEIYPISSSNQATIGTLVTFFNKREISQNIRLYMWQQTAIVLVIFVSVGFLLFLTYRSLTKSLGLLGDVMHRISAGQRAALHEPIEIETDPSHPEEVKELALSFNQMIEEITSLNQKIFDSYTYLYDLEMSNRQTEIAYLRSQINPHFLYNTLAMISGLSAAGEQQLVIAVTDSLSQMYQYSVTGREMVSVQEELDIIKSYVDIQMLRFGDRFRTRYDFTPEALEAEIPKMILQPIVENAIFHGIEPSLHSGKLEIGGRKNKTDNTLVLWVYDTGVGMSEKRLAQVRSSLLEGIEEHVSTPTDTTTPRTENIGLHNANSRIHLYYGAPYKLWIDSTQGQGTNVQIKIPYTSYREG